LLQATDGGGIKTQELLWFLSEDSTFLSCWLFCADFRHLGLVAILNGNKINSPC